MSKVAIIGMACLFPGAPDLATFWSNIIGSVDAMREAGEREWDPETHFKPGSTEFAYTYAKTGGFISDVAHFDPLKFGVMPNAVAGSDPDQLLTLKVAYDALSDAGYLNRDFNRDRAEVVLGRIGAPGAGSMNLIQQSKTVGEITDILRAVLSEADEDIIEEVAKQVQSKLQPCTSDNIPSVMPNVIAGRVAAKLGFRGKSLLVDAACASSMVAIESAVQDLLSNTCDFALTGGVYVNSSASMFKMFAALGALSAADVIRPFDENADGTLLGEGIGLLCLRRYEDAVRDGDKIYATICGVASSSDGFGGSVLAPSMEGEALAMRRAYELAQINPRSVELLEAHGTGTPTGDVVELQAVQSVFGGSAEDNSWCAVGSIKSMIGHCQSASAVAGVIKAALSLYHKVLPPTLHVEKPNSKIDWAKHPCYVNTQTRPWIHADVTGEPRRAAISAFGFGGVNGHAVLEETDQHEFTLAQKWDSEIFIFSSKGRARLAEQIEHVADIVGKRPDISFKDLAYTLNCNKQHEGEYRAAIIASTPQELLARLKRASTLILNPNNKKVQEVERGIFFSAPEGRIGGKLAFVYPGLGSAYANMLSDLCVHFPEVRNVFDICDSVALRAGAKIPPSKIIFPTDPKHNVDATTLASADFAVCAVLLAEYALYELLKHLEVIPDALLGCSTGEFAAITTGGACDILSNAEQFYAMSTNAARSIPEEALAKLRSLRVLAAADDVLKIGGKNIYLSADLGDDHIIVTGDEESVAKLGTELRAKRIAFQQLPIAIPYHTPLVQGLVDADNEMVRNTSVDDISIPIWSCSRGGELPNDDAAMRELFIKLFTKPVALRQTINAMYDAGVRKFVEVGPNGVMTVIVGGILGKRPSLTIASNLQSRSGIMQLHTLLGALFVEDQTPKFDYLYARRNPQTIALDGVAKDAVRKGILLDLRHSPLRIDPSALPRRTTIVAHDVGDEFEHVFEQDKVVETFLNTNTAFYDQMNVVQEQVLKAFLATSTATQCDPIEAAVDMLPFLSRMHAYEDGDLTVATLDIALDSDLYLLDHAIGGQVSTEPKLRLYLMPLMVALEIMAEAAYIRAESGGVLGRIEQVKAFRRIIVDHEPLPIRLVVSTDGRKVTVQLFQPDDEDTTPSMVADYLFGDYCDWSSESFEMSGKPPEHLTTPEKLYTPQTMFHGPRMQSVTAINQVADKRIAGDVQARAATGWFRDILEPRFLIDPLLLDNGSQFVLFYLYEKAMPATALLPFFIESIEVFGSRDDLEIGAHGAAVLHSITNKATEASVEIGDDDFVWCRINNINSRRIALPDEWLAFVADPIGTTFGEQASNYVFVDGKLLPEDDTVLDWCAEYVLTKTERAIWRTEAKTAKRKRDWLLGRIAGKEAVRRVIAQPLAMQDIEIFNDEYRAPIVSLRNPELPSINLSLSHSNSVAVASAVSNGRAGIDLELAGNARPEMTETFANKAELELLGGEDITKLWTAKEALYKAFRGLVPMESFRLSEVKSPNQFVFQQNDKSHIVSFEIRQNMIVAHALCQARFSQPNS
jgi:acyl transferase domain-containing protein/phosphopantetheinyl transferase (holo-ACP synthase)